MSNFKPRKVTRRDLSKVSMMSSKLNVYNGEGGSSPVLKDTSMVRVYSGGLRQLSSSLPNIQCK